MIEAAAANWAALDAGVADKIFFTTPQDFGRPAFPACGWRRRQTPSQGCSAIPNVPSTPSGPTNFPSKHGCSEILMFTGIEELGTITAYGAMPQAPG
jgi:hypothetical protein